MGIVLANLRYFLIGQYPNGPIGGLAITIYLAIIGLVASTCVGLLAGAMQAVGPLGLRAMMFIYVQVIRGVPFITFVFWVFFFMPKIIGYQGVTGLESAVVALTIFNGAYIAEIVRGAIDSVPRGQSEAGLSSGLTRWQVLSLIVIPQAVRKIYPPLVNRFVNLLIGTSIVYIVGVTELMRMAVIVNNREINYPVEIFGFVGLVYFGLCFPLSRYAERKQKEEQMVKL